MTGLLAALLGGCAVPDKPQRPEVYDFGPPATAPVTAPAAAQRPARAALALAEVDAPPALDGTAMLYRLAYADARALRPYGLARWSMAPAQLLGQRLREALAQQGPVLRPGDAGVTRLLRVELEEFAQVFDGPASSQGTVRLRATLLQTGPAGDRLLAQRSLLVQRPAPSGDAAGGVRALAAACDAAVAELGQWLQAQP